jgi:hypothetical protein
VAERPAVAIRRDVSLGYVSPAGAAEDYGLPEPVAEQIGAVVA